MMLQRLSEHENSGKIVLPPIVLPCVLDVATIDVNAGLSTLHESNLPATRDIFMVEMLP